MGERPPVLAATRWRSNAELIVAVCRLGYLKVDDLVFDATYGRGRWWTKVMPKRLITSDLDKGHPDLRSDFRQPPFAEATFDVVAFDPPYKLNGASTMMVDERYGVEVRARWQDRMQLCLDGIAGLAPTVRPGGFMLIKCQDQVCSGHVRWQTRVFADEAERRGLTLVDQMHMLGGRPQPAGRRQVHSRRNFSTLLVTKAGS